MPEYMKARKVKVRPTQKNSIYLEITVPKIAIDNKIIQAGDFLTPVIDSVLIYLPKGKEIVPEKLKEAIIDSIEG